MIEAKRRAAILGGGRRAVQRRALSFGVSEEAIDAARDVTELKRDRRQAMRLRVQFRAVSGAHHLFRSSPASSSACSTARGTALTSVSVPRTTARGVMECIHCGNYSCRAILRHRALDGRQGRACLAELGALS